MNFCRLIGFPLRSNMFLGGAVCASQQNSGANVRFGSKADIVRVSTDVRFTPKSGHRLPVLECPLCAKSRHQSQKELCGEPICTITMRRPNRSNLRGAVTRPFQRRSAIAGRCSDAALETK